MEELRNISSKIPVETYTQLRNYCEKEKITPSHFIRALIEKNVVRVVPLKKAGINRITYNKKQDNFEWIIDEDDGNQIKVALGINAEFLSNLIQESISAMALRNDYLKKSKKSSVAFPTDIKQLRM
ncbi:Uncharacterised protein [uncultured archaeon]|nr:Uncharacterised protein [uncultured archaeon]